MLLEVSLILYHTFADGQTLELRGDHAETGFLRDNYLALYLFFWCSWHLGSLKVALWVKAVNSEPALQLRAFIAIREKIEFTRQVVKVEIFQIALSS